jgi:hypothetical protein
MLKFKKIKSEGEGEGGVDEILARGIGLGESATKSFREAVALSD